MTKKFVWIGFFVDSTLGNMLPLLWDGDAISISGGQSGNARSRVSRIGRTSDERNQYRLRRTANGRICLTIVAVETRVWSLINRTFPGKGTTLRFRLNSLTNSEILSR